MKVNSTGLGSTTLQSEFMGFKTTAVDNKMQSQYEGKDGTYLIMEIETVKPVHWTICVGIDGKDMRKIIKHVLNPKVIFRSLSLIVRGSKLE